MSKPQVPDHFYRTTYAGGKTGEGIPCTVTFRNLERARSLAAGVLRGRSLCIAVPFLHKAAEGDDGGQQKLVSLAFKPVCSTKSHVTMLLPMTSHLLRPPCQTLKRTKTTKARNSPNNVTPSTERKVLIFIIIHTQSADSTRAACGEVG